VHIQNKVIKLNVHIRISDSESLCEIQIWPRNWPRNMNDREILCHLCSRPGMQSLSHLNAWRRTSRWSVWLNISTRILPANNRIRRLSTNRFPRHELHPIIEIYLLSGGNLKQLHTAIRRATSNTRSSNATVNIGPPRSLTFL
jgi:hypothetical protein